MSWYGWEAEIDLALDKAGVETMAELPDQDVVQLLERLKSLEDCVQNGMGSPDAPPGT